MWYSKWISILWYSNLFRCTCITILLQMNHKKSSFDPLIRCLELLLNVLLTNRNVKKWLNISADFLMQWLLFLLIFFFCSHEISMDCWDHASWNSAFTKDTKLYILLQRLHQECNARPKFDLSLINIFYSQEWSGHKSGADILVFFLPCTSA